MNPEWRSRYEKAIEVAHQAGRFALKHFDCDVAVEWKQDRSPVTLADRGAEEILRISLLGAFPDDGFLGEESGATPATSWSSMASMRGTWAHSFLSSKKPAAR